MTKRSVRKAILPAAGLGTRFLPATKASPKEMLAVVDKPLIQYAVEEAIGCGIDEFVVITGKNKRAIEDHFDVALELEESLKKSDKLHMMAEIKWLENINFAYIRQGAPLGLGHAIYCARPYVKDEAVAVILSDDIIPPGETLLKDMIKLYAKLDAPVIAIQRVPRSEVSHYGVIAGVEEGHGVVRITDMVEKPKVSEAPSDLAIIGRYILTPDIFDMLETQKPVRGGEIQLTDALKRLLGKRPVYGLIFEGTRYDAGDKLGFLKATVEFALVDERLSAGFREYLKGRAAAL